MNIDQIPEAFRHEFTKVLNPRHWSVRENEAVRIDCGRFYVSIICGESFYCKPRARLESLAAYESLEVAICWKTPIFFKPHGKWGRGLTSFVHLEDLGLTNPEEHFVYDDVAGYMPVEEVVALIVRLQAWAAKSKRSTQTIERSVRRRKAAERHRWNWETRQEKKARLHEAKVELAVKNIREANERSQKAAEFKARQERSRGRAVPPNALEDDDSHGAGGGPWTAV